MITEKTAGFSAILKKELRVYFTAPTAYIAIVFFIVTIAAGFFVAGQFFIRGDSSLRPFFSLFPFVSVLVIPAITMGSWAEEIHSGTADLLYTLPISEGTLVLAKFCASLIVFAAAVLLTMPIPIFVSLLGAVDVPSTVVAYAGILLFGCAACAAGQCVSLLTRNQITAFILTACALLLFTTIHLLPSLADVPARIAAFCNSLSFAWHFESAAKGILDTRDVVFFGGITFAALYGTSGILLLRKWSKR